MYIWERDCVNKFQFPLKIIFEVFPLNNVQMGTEPLQMWQTFYFQHFKVYLNCLIFIQYQVSNSPTA